MPWCPSCKTEYREGFVECADCGCDLVEELDACVQEDDLANEREHLPIDWEYLDIFVDEQEAQIIESFLNSDGITTWKKYPGFSDMSKIVGGMTKLGVAIYVPRERLEDARMIVEDILGNQRMANDEANNEALDEAFPDEVFEEEDIENEDYRDEESSAYHPSPKYSERPFILRWLLICTLVFLVYTFFLAR